MKTSSTSKGLYGAFMLALGISLTGCGGGGGSTPPTAVSLGGTVAAGILMNADVKIYDATKATKSALGTPIQTAETDANGKYGPVKLPEGFDQPMLIVVTAKAGSRMKDEVFGNIPVPANFELRSVVPAEALASSTLTAHVTPYTNLMSRIVENKLGQTGTNGANAAINQARNVVNQLTGNVDPLNTDPVADSRMVVRLAAISKMASSAGNDPDNCGAQISDSDKVACTVETLAKAVTPMGSDDDTSGGTYTRNINQTILSALAGAAQALDTADILLKTGSTDFSKSELDGSVSEAANKLTEVAQHTNLTVPDSATAGGLQQAKEFFANLRTGVLPYSNSKGTGFLDIETSNLQDEMHQLHSAYLSGLTVVTKMVSWNANLLDDTLPRSCQMGQTQAGYTWRAVCTYRNLTVVFDNNENTKQGDWSISGTGQALKGKFSYDDTSMTLNGYVPAMLSGSVRTKVGLGLQSQTGLSYPGYKEAPLKVTRALLAGNTYRYTITGTMKDEAAITAKNMSSSNAAASDGTVCAPNATCPTYASRLKLEFGNISFDNANPTTPGVADTSTAYIDLDESNVDAKVLGSEMIGKYITQHYRFIGNFAISSLQMATTTEGDTPVIGGKASFTGTVNGKGMEYANYYFNLPGENNTSNDFDLLVGKFDADWNGTSDTGTLAFAGTVKKISADTGIKLLITMAKTGVSTGTVSITYNDYNKGISITGSSAYDDNSTSTQYLTVSDGNGISVKIGDDNTAQVMKGSTKLADINGNRVTYVDGTFESLF